MAVNTSTSNGDLSRDLWGDISCQGADQQLEDHEMHPNQGLFLCIESHNSSIMDTGLECHEKNIARRILQGDSISKSAGVRPRTRQVDNIHSLK